MFYNMFSLLETTHLLNLCSFNYSYTKGEGGGGGGGKVNAFAR